MARFKFVYKLDSKFIGKVHNDSQGRTVLTDKLTQTVLKALYNKNNKFISRDVKG